MARPVVKKDDIERAAIHLLATRGLAETTVRDVAALAGVAEGALYRHYRGKNEMAWALYCREVAAFTARFRPLLEADPAAAGGVQALLAAAVEFIYRFYRDEPDRLVFVLLTRRGFPSQELPDLDADPDRAVERFVRRLQRLHLARRDDPRLLMAMLRGAVLEPILMHRTGRLGRHPLALAGQVAEACARILAVPAEPKGRAKARPAQRRRRP